MRAFWLGAETISLAGPLLAQLLRHNKTPSPDNLSGLVDQLQQQMALTLFLTGAPNLAAFRRKEALIDNKLL
jgi:isopentenyl diphosphate isomerase/L-lactate dehydrogenase-like FMN-dependent dehydrogenase